MWRYVIRGRLIHPEILQGLAAAGHGSKVLIADGNYPLSTQTHPGTQRVYVNLRPGVVSVTDVLEAIASAIPIEAAVTMRPSGDSVPPVHREFAAILEGVSVEGVDRFAFYALAREPDVALAIATGDQRLYANILLTIGVLGSE